MLLFAGRVISDSSSSASRIFAAASRNPFSISGSRFQVRAMAGSASQLFKKIQIQRDDTVSQSLFFFFLNLDFGCQSVISLQNGWYLFFDWVIRHLMHMLSGKKMLLVLLYFKSGGVSISRSRTMLSKSPNLALDSRPLFQSMYPQINLFLSLSLYKCQLNSRDISFVQFVSRKGRFGRC